MNLAHVVVGRNLRNVMADKILFTRFPLESRFGGAEVQTLSLMKGLGDRGYEVKFIGSCPTLLEAFREPRSAIRVKKLEIGPPPVTKWGAISFLWRKRNMKKRLIEELRKCFDSAQHDTTIFMLSLSEKLLLTDWCVQNNIKVIWVEHDKIGRWLRWNPWLPKLRKLSRLATTVTVSDLSRDIYLDMGWREEDVVSIPNGIETADCGPRSAIRKIDHSCFRIGCISRLTYDKGIDVLIKAVKDLPNVKLEIVGDGPEEDNLKAISNGVKFVESVPNIKEFYDRIDCLVLPSRENDPFGLVVAEAMMRGIPTICTDACGISRHISEDDSIVTPANNTEALKNGISEIQKEEMWEKLSINGERTARERFSIERMIDRYENILEKN
jgi:glycosyltransferase involved in cell wall biosynthesis